MTVRWTEKAVACLEDISDHISEDNPYFAAYRVQNEAVEILYIRHGAQDR